MEERLERESEWGDESTSKRYVVASARVWESRGVICQRGRTWRGSHEISPEIRRLLNRSGDANPKLASSPSWSLAIFWDISEISVEYRIFLKEYYWKKSNNNNHITSAYYLKKFQYHLDDTETFSASKQTLLCPRYFDLKMSKILF